MKQGALVILLGTHFALRAEKVQDGLFQHPVRYFIDTNILIHAYDLDAGEKRDRARRALQDAWENGNGILSTQVLQEFYVNVTRKIPQPLAPAEARGILGSYMPTGMWWRTASDHSHGF